jgi:SsrA-binding protein
MLDQRYESGDSYTNPRAIQRFTRIIRSQLNGSGQEYMGKKKTKQSAGNVIAVNRRARHDFFIEDRFEAGLALEGWEVKSLRAGNAQLTEAYVNVRQGEAWLVGAHFSPLKTVSTHIKADPTRSRKLLLHRYELDRLTGAVERKGYTLVPLDLHWHKGRAKLSIGLGKGKKQHDKRADRKDRDWQRQKERILKH